jgi:hypothetical protein
MKKTIALLLVLLVAFAFAACGKDSTGTKEEALTPNYALELYNKSLKNLQPSQTGSYAVDMDCTFKMEMSAAGEEMALSMDFNEKIKTDAGKIAGLRVEASMDMGTVKIDDMKYWLGADGKIYMSAFGVTNEADESMVESLTSSVEPPPITDVSFVKDVKRAQVTGGYKYTLSVDGTAMKSYVQEQLAQQLDTSDIDEIDIGDFNVIYIVGNNDLLMEMKMEFTFTITVQGETADAKMAMSIKVNAMGNDVVINNSDLDATL